MSETCGNFCPIGGAHQIEVRCTLPAGHGLRHRGSVGRRADLEVTWDDTGWKLVEPQRWSEMLMDAISSPRIPPGARLPWDEPRRLYIVLPRLADVEVVADHRVPPRTVLVLQEPSPEEVLQAWPHGGFPVERGGRQVLCRILATILLPLSP